MKKFIIGAMAMCSIGVVACTHTNEEAQSPRQTATCG
jgi:hypothetical protein